MKESRREIPVKSTTPWRERAPVGDHQVMVVLLNMGGPGSISEVRGFLKRVFSDPWIIRFPLSFLLQSFFAHLLVFFRGRKTEDRYRLIGGGSPIGESTRRQAAALAEELKKRGRDLSVTICFNYSQPFSQETIARIKESGKTCVLPVSLYPHYSKATTGSSLYHLKKTAQKNFPELIFLNSEPYYLADSYIEAFVDRIKEGIQPSESLDDFYLLFSAHGLPLYFLMEGDPYPFQIVQTASKIADRLGRRREWTVSYQSAVGPMRWLKPTTADVLRDLAEAGIKKLLVVPISFVSDHIETLCEIDMEYRVLAEDWGIEDFRMTRALECHPRFIEALADCVEASLENFVTAESLKKGESRVAF